MTSPAIRRQDDDDEWEYVNLDDINNGARAETDYQIIPIGCERAGADFLMRMTMRMRMRMTMTLRMRMTMRMRMRMKALNSEIG